MTWTPDRVFHVEACGCEWEQEWCGPWEDRANCRHALKQTCESHLYRIGTYRYLGQPIERTGGPW